MRFFDAEQVHARCDYVPLVDALERYHRDEPQVMEDMLLTQASDSGTDTHFFIRAAWQREQILGAKLVTAFWDNPDRPEALPAVQAIYTLFDGSNGEPLAVLDGTALTYRKTAADSALGSRYLSRPDAQTVLMVGAGGLAPHLITAHRAVRPSIDRLLIWNRTQARAQTLAASLDADDLAVEVVNDLAAAVGEADLVVCATKTNEPLIKGDWLRPGVHLDLVGAFTPDMREADDDALRGASIFVDSRATTLRDVGEIAIPLANGVIDEADVLADHYDLAQGRISGRKDAAEITLFKNGGGGHLDLMTANFVVSAN